jgi:hypothetical protein
LTFCEIWLFRPHGVFTIEALYVFDLVMNSFNVSRNLALPATCVVAKGTVEVSDLVSLLYVYFTSCYTSNVHRQSRVRGISAHFFFKYILSIM